MVWLHRWMDVSALTTTEGIPVELIHMGKHNHSSGPDFLEATLKIGSTKWVGQVEIHWRSSDWYAHGHQGDPAYENVILHVVYEHDRPVYNRHGEELPTLELKGRIQKRLHQRYEQLYTGSSRLPCANFIAQVEPIRINAWLDRMLAERWEQKTASIRTSHRAGMSDWIEVFYQLLARYIGTQYNRAPMEELARLVPMKRLTRFASSLDRAALLLGVGGFLGQQIAFDSSERYRVELMERYAFLRLKYSDLGSLEQNWMTGRVRPTNHPSRRVAQLAAVSVLLPDLYQKIIQGDLPDWSALELDMDPFWERHYSLQSSSKRPMKTGFSETMSDLLNINVAAPLLFFYAQESGNERLKERAITSMHAIVPEENETTRFFSEHGVHCTSAAHSQALIQLRTNYCNHKKCVLCNIGRTIIAKA